MARITWLGEGGSDAPLSTTWFGRELRAGEAVEIDDARLIAKAKGSRFFKVEEAPAVPVTQWREPATEADPADEDEDEPRPAPHRPTSAREDGRERPDVAKPKHRPVKHR